MNKIRDQDIDSSKKNVKNLRETVLTENIENSNLESLKNQVKTRPKSAYSKMMMRSSSITGPNQSKKFIRPMSGKPKNTILKGSSIVTFEMPSESAKEPFVIHEEEDASTPE